LKTQSLDFIDKPDILGRNASKIMKQWIANFPSDYLKAGNKASDLADLFFDLGDNTKNR